MRSQKRNHMAITCARWISVIGMTNKKKRSIPNAGHPACPWSLTLAETQWMAELFHNTRVEREGALKIGYTNKYMRQHKAAPDAFWRNLAMIRTPKQVPPPIVQQHSSSI